jgi:cysteinyl-tRNA synthetase
MCDDLNTSVALAKAYEGTKVILRQSEHNAAEGRSALDFLRRVNDLLGIVYPQHADPCGPSTAPAVSVSAEMVESKLAERGEAKRNKNFARADAIRDELEAMGIEVRDTPDGVVWKPKSFSSL